MITKENMERGAKIVAETGGHYSYSRGHINNSIEYPKEMKVFDFRRYDLDHCPLLHVSQMSESVNGKYVSWEQVKEFIRLMSKYRLKIDIDAGSVDGND